MASLHVFEIDAVKSLTQSTKNLCQLFHQKFDHFVWFDLLWAKSAVSLAVKKWHLGFVVEKNVNFLKAIILSVIKEVY